MYIVRLVLETFYQAKVLDAFESLAFEAIPYTFVFIMP